MKRKQKTIVADGPIPHLGEALEFMRLIWALDHALQTTSKRMAVTIGITGPQRMVLRMVGRFPGIPAGQLARILLVDPSTLTGILQRLEQAEFLTRRADSTDGRRSLFELTARGRRFDIEMPGTVEAAVTAALERLGAEEIRAARNALNSMVDSLERQPLRAPRGRFTARKR